MHYFNIPMSDKDYPKDESTEKFLNITKEEGNWPFYVHCAGWPSSERRDGSDV